MRIATLLLSILDAAAALFLAVYIFVVLADPMFLGLDMFVGWSTTVLCLVTAVPAFILAFGGRRVKTALVFALAFPVGVAAILAGVFVYFTYYL